MELKFLRKQRHESYKKCCNTINPSMGLKNVWSVVKGLQIRKSHYSTNIYNDSNLPKVASLQQELLNTNMLPTNIPYDTYLDENNPLDNSFTSEEFYLALSSCKRDTAPGRDSITYTILKKLQISGRKLLLGIFNN